MKTTRMTKLVLSLAALLGCVEHRPLRNGLRDEQIYLTKADLTSPNPKLLPEVVDDGWLHKVTVVKASSPNVVGDWAFPGFESETKYVKFRFAENALQILDGRTLMLDAPGDRNDDLATSTARVLMEFAGQHVDVKLRESLDGERTNFIEENTEESWQKRQKFKVDFEKTSLDPITTWAWFYGQFLHECAHPVSANLVPQSFEWDAEDQYMSFVVETTYLLTVEGGCYDLVSLAFGAGTATIQYRFSFYRPGKSSFQPTAIDEKHPVNKKYGAFQVMNLFRDPKTNILSAKTLLQRWNPDREEPVVFYFHEGFPEKFKPMFQEIKEQTNAILEQAGAKLRFDFREWNDGGIERKLGDIRYSFVVWHQDIDTTRGLLGYGPSTSDPRTGEVISANLNLYNIGLDYYRYLIQQFLEQSGGLRKPDPNKKWEELSCVDGQTVAPVDGSGRYNTGLFNEMRRTMQVLENTGTPDDFLPTPARGREAFLAEYHRLLPEYRYVEPAWNPYVYRPGEAPLFDFPQRLKKERQFLDQMHLVLKNGNPFGPVGLYSREGIGRQLEFLQKFREWRKNHERLVVDQEMLLSLKNVYTFDANDAVTAISRSARRCVNGRWESDEQYRERIVEDVVFHVAIHEFGHNLGLRHNFYGSVDAKHMRPNELSASVMDYVAAWEEASSARQWGAYDVAALKWIYGTDSVRQQMMREDFLYCTDEHRFRSPMCAAHDLGITPSQVVLNAIERYDMLYAIRNRRAYRTFWDTTGYINAVYSATFPLLRMWYLLQFDWAGGGVQSTLKRLDQVEGRPLRTDQEYDEISIDLYNDGAAASQLISAFFDAIINQPASYRNYQTEFDPFYGDILRVGIIIDKLFATFAFMDLHEVGNYNPNVATYVAMYDAPFGGQDLALQLRVLDNMLGANYDTFPWFRYYALNIFAAVTNTNLVSTLSLKDRIGIRRYNTRQDLELEFPTVLEQVNRPDNPAKIFVHEGEQYVYTYLAERGWHLVARKSRSPVSYQYIKEYNEALASGSTTEDTYGLKVLLAYYEYFNNFSGY